MSPPGTTATLGSVAAELSTPQSLCDSPHRGHFPTCGGDPVRGGTEAERTVGPQSGGSGGDISATVGIVMR